MPLNLFLSFIASLVPIACANPIYTYPQEVRKRNYVRISTEKCDECVTLDEFYKHNRLGFLLFMERNLAFSHQYKDAVINGWMQVCEKMRWSRIACGMIDMVSREDRAYAERYIDPKTAPAHIVVRDAEPIMASQDQVNLLLKKPGDKDTMLEHVGLLLKEDGPLESLLLSSQVSGKDALTRHLRTHTLVIAAFVGEDVRLGDTFRAVVQEAVLKHKLADRLQESSNKGGREGKGKTTLREKERSRIAFLAVRGKGLGRHFNVSDAHMDSCVGAFIGGELQPDVESIASQASSSQHAKLLPIITRVVESAVLASHGTHKGLAQEDYRGLKQKEKEKGESFICRALMT